MRKMDTGKVTSKVKQREVYLIAFPFSEGDSSKVRPGIVVSNSDYNSSQRDILMVPMTSQIKSLPYSFVIGADDFEEGHLKKESGVRCDKLVSVHEKRFVHKIGRIKKETLERIKTEIFAVLSE
jgi:mRNA interferase MazF